MKARYSYPLLFLLPSVMAASLVTVFAVGAGAGVLWIFVYGDNPWPQSANVLLMGIAVTASVLTLAALVASSYSFGKKREAAGGLRRSDVAIAIGLSVSLPLLVLLHQWQVGNLGGKPLPAGSSSAQGAALNA